MEEEINQGSKMGKMVFLGLLFLVLVAVVAYLVLGAQSDTPLPTSDSSDEISDLVRETSVEVTSAPSANPLESVTPTANPIEKTNPFRDDYQNPFE